MGAARQRMRYIEDVLIIEHYLIEYAFEYNKLILPENEITNLYVLEQ
jgi:hypothetical protein